MRSVDHHINNIPSRIMEINPNSSSLCHSVIGMTEEEYNLLQAKDPTTAYVMKDSPNVYLGDHLLPKVMNTRQYLVGFDMRSHMYVVYDNFISGSRDHLVPVYTTDKPKLAIAALHNYQAWGNLFMYAMDVEEIVTDYIDSVYGINEAIISIISCIGFRDDPRLQELNEYAVHYNVNKNDRDLPQLYREQLHNLKTRYPEGLISLYSDIYDCFIMYNFFKKSKKSNLHEEVRSILDICERYIGPVAPNFGSTLFETNSLPNLK